MPARRRRELGARAEVDELFRAHALTRAVARRTKAMTTTPTSPEALAEALQGRGCEHVDGAATARGGGDARRVSGQSTVSVRLEQKV